MITIEKFSNIDGDKWIIPAFEILHGDLTDNVIALSTLAMAYNNDILQIEEFYKAYRKDSEYIQCMVGFKLFPETPCLVYDK